MQNKSLLATLGLVAIGVIVYSVWHAALSPVRSGGNEEGVICTLDAMQCPDGSWVGRTGPNCQFVCPSASSTTSATSATVTTKINQKATLLSEGITPLAIVEDSRCPVNVQCIQAGTVRMRVRLDTGMGTTEYVFKLNEQMTTETQTITLVAVTPEKNTTTSINPEDYRFVFRGVAR